MTSPSREVELKAVVDDLPGARQAVEGAGAQLVFSGRLQDRRYDDEQRTLTAADVVLRLRTYKDAEEVRAHLDWKGPTEFDNGFKVRDELTTGVSDPDALSAMLGALGYVVIREIDRVIAQYELQGTVIRFEQYPRMDALVEVEGTPNGIEKSILALGIPRVNFTSQRLPEFVRSFENRTGLRAALCDQELRGDYRYSVRDA